MLNSRYTLNPAATNEYECIKACVGNPIVVLDPCSSSSIQDLLLSRIAVGPNVTFDQIKKAIDELIDLNYPLINRILEVSAYYCSLSMLSIYCANPTEFESLKLGEDNQGYFNARNNLIVVSTRMPLSQSLIHELTHAVRRYIMISPDPTATRHQEFCKNRFPTFFKQTFKDTQPTSDEKAELDSIERDAAEWSRLGVALAPKLSSVEWEKMINRDRVGSEIFHARRSNVRAQQQLRRDFYDVFNGYKESDYAEEFLPFFLQHFVRAAYHEKVTSLQSWVVEYTQTPEEFVTATYNARLLGMMWSALSSSILENFVKGDFRTRLDHYAVSIVPFLDKKQAAPLRDSEFYSVSFAEPNRINNSMSLSRL